jgi:DNA-binding transcriptional LysR family regulator
MIRRFVIRFGDYNGDVELRQLEHFAAVAEEGSFTKAARRLSYVQSAISVSIQSLERELGIRLFDRTTHRVVLTSAGEALIEPARRALHAAEEIRDQAAAVRGVIRGTLRVGIMQSFTFGDIPGSLGEFHRLHPDVEIQLRPAIGGSAAIIDELKHGVVDLAFVAIDEISPDIEAEALGSEELVAVGRPELLRRDDEAVALSELADAEFIDVPVGWGIRTVVDRAFAQSGLERRVTIEVADMGTVVALLRAGLGIAIVPPSFLPADDRELVTRSLVPEVRWSFGIITPAGKSLTAAARSLAELVLASNRTQSSF